MLKEQSSQARCLCGFGVTPRGSDLSQRLHRLAPRDARRWDMGPGGFCLIYSFLSLEGKFCSFMARLSSFQS